jgi:hypothetical protein
MTMILPNHLVKLSEAVHVVESALAGGTPDQPVVIGLREVLGHDVGDGRASSAAKAAIWQAVDDGALRVAAISAHSKEAIDLDPAVTRSIRLLRRVNSFAYLRRGDPEWADVTKWFGTRVADITLVVRKTELRKLAQRLMRIRRRKRPANPVSKAGRPSKQKSVQQAIELIVERGQWRILQSIKELTLLVNRNAAVASRVSRDTVARALDSLFKETKDRRYARTRRTR